MSNLKIALGAGAAMALGFAGAPAHAVPPTPTHVDCDSTDITPNAYTPNSVGCVGWTAGNLNNVLAGGTATGATDTVLDAFVGAGTHVALEKIDGSNTLDHFFINFNAPLFGETVISIHVGGANGNKGIGYESTAFFKFDAGSTGLDIVTFNHGGFSNAVLWSTSKDPHQEGFLPEPATWALMLLGFGMIGGALRRRQKQTVQYRFA